MISKYLISISQSDAIDKETIHDPESKLKIGVINLLSAAFKPKKGELHYFVSDQNNQLLLAFETEGYKAHKNILVLDMIARYCAHLGFIHAKIQSTMPAI